MPVAGPMTRLCIAAFLNGCCGTSRTTSLRQEQREIALTVLKPTPRSADGSLDIGNFLHGNPT